ncbi:MAG: tRNA preQ1(34) S-adenosylmethionine ribosyltransferase-isomerase QueA [Clostridia bacterium]|nr:tRNA preQ1(34) S-adenosylmethionine ribosyltransferase-isomerase QueA [Clostridia bacterium]
MKLSDFYYDLPEELIAQTPLEDRTSSRLLVLNKENGDISHRTFKDIKEYLNPGDLLVLNNTRVIPARLYGIKSKTGSKIEFLLLKRIDLTKWEVILKPGKKAREGAEFSFGDGLLNAKVIKVKEDGNRIVEFSYNGVFEDILDKLGQMPLPPYIKEKLKDKERYQTVYSKHEGSSAAPTAGLHFTNELLDEIKNMGVKISFVTLHVGLGTFRPVKCDNIKEHKMHSEHFFIDKSTCDMINETKKNGNKVIAVGTTSVRVLESVARDDGYLEPCEGDTEIFIYPGYKFKVVDKLITNFHLPESTLLMLICALSDKDTIFKAYKAAVNEKYRFFSFGDAMFIQ